MADRKRCPRRARVERVVEIGGVTGSSSPLWFRAGIRFSVSQDQRLEAVRKRIRSFDILYYFDLHLFLVSSPICNCLKRSQ